MDALKIALETLLVGALALPWLLLGLHLFAPEAKVWLQELLPTSKDTIQYAIAGIVALALAYVVGAAVLRLAQDFYNDDDLGIPLPPEDGIRASVYCDPADQPWVFDTGVALTGEYAGATIKKLCDEHGLPDRSRRDAALQHIQQIFKLQENAVLLMGETQTSQIRHIHQQLLVLQGSGFDGVIALALCLLAWNAQQKHRGPRLILPIVFFAWVFFVGLLWNHLDIRELSQISRLLRWIPNDPPFTELTLMLLAIAGGYLSVNQPKPPRLVSYGTGCLAAFLLTGLAYAGWYWTEILYDRMVISSYYASHYLLVKPPF